MSLIDHHSNHYTSYAFTCAILKRGIIFSRFILTTILRFKSVDPLYFSFFPSVSFISLVWRSILSVNFSRDRNCFSKENRCGNTTSDPVYSARWLQKQGNSNVFGINPFHCVRFDERAASNRFPCLSSVSFQPDTFRTFAERCIILLPWLSLALIFVLTYSSLINPTVRWNVYRNSFPPISSSFQTLLVSSFSNAGIPMQIHLYQRFLFPFFSLWNVGAFFKAVSINNSYVCFLSNIKSKHNFGIVLTTIGHSNCCFLWLLNI